MLVRYNREDNFNFFIHEDEFLNEFMKDEFNDLPKEEVLPANEPLEEKEEILKVVNSSTETQALEESDDPEASVTGHAKPPKPLPVKEKDELEPIPSHKNIITIDGKNFELTPVS